jgi:hypothetical protein
MLFARAFRLGVLVVSLALLCVPASALADVEPNNGLLQAEGPVAGGVAYPGVSATDNDVDWYMFYANSQVELDIQVTSPDAEWDECYVTLRGADGGFIDSMYVTKNSVYHFRYTTPPGVNRFYISARCPTGRHYQFTINPAGGVTSGPRPFGDPVPTGEPNEFRSQAIGPLVGGVDYTGVQGTDNDADWFYFYALGPRALDIAVTSPDGCSDGDVTLYDGGGDWIADASANPDSITHLQHTTPAGVNQFYLQAECDSTGGRYQFRIDPADAITAQPPPPPAPPGPSAACLEARGLRALYRKRVRRLTRKVADADTIRQWKRYRRKRRTAMRRLNRAKAAVRTNCV